MNQHSLRTRPAVRLQALVLAAAALGTSGCTSLTGLGGSTSYSCAAPVGVHCTSVSGTYANAMRGAAAPPAPAASGVPAPSVAPRMPLMGEAESLRSSARILRLWIKPWEDADQDLHDQGYVYVQVEPGRWLIDHAQRRIRDAHAPLRPPPRPPAGAAADAGREGLGGPQRPGLPPAIVPSGARPSGAPAAADDPTE